jgi:hypothetical protein
LAPIGREGCGTAEVPLVFVFRNDTSKLGRGGRFCPSAASAPRPVVTAGRLCRSRGGWAIKHHWFCLRRLDIGRNEPCHRIFRSRGATGAFGKGLDVRTVGVSFSSIITESLGEWVMSQRDARLERGYSSVWDSDLLSATLSQDEPDSTTPAAIGHAKLRHVVLVESDQDYREVLTVVLLGLGLSFTLSPMARRCLAHLPPHSMPTLPFSIGTCQRCRARSCWLNCASVMPPCPSCSWPTRS